MRKKKEIFFLFDEMKFIDLAKYLFTWYIYIEAKLSFEEKLQLTKLLKEY